MVRIEEQHIAERVVRFTVNGEQLPGGSGLGLIDGEGSLECQKLWKYGTLCPG